MYHLTLCQFLFDNLDVKDMPNFLCYVFLKRVKKKEEKEGMEVLTTIVFLNWEPVEFAQKNPGILLEFLR